MVMLHPEKDGLRTRQSFSKIKEVIEMPNLIEVQKDSYNWFIFRLVNTILINNMSMYILVVS